MMLSSSLVHLKKQKTFFPLIRVYKLLHVMENPLQLHKCVMSNEKACKIIHLQLQLCFVARTSISLAYSIKHTAAEFLILILTENV